MPKKFNGINQKAASASARKVAAEERKLTKQQKEVEDLEWEDNDKHVLRKQKRKEQRQQKRKSALEKKAETKVLLEQETAKMKSKSSSSSSTKLTRLEIATKTQKRSPLRSSKRSAEIRSPKLSKKNIEKNLNRFVDEVDARNVTEAIAALNFQRPAQDKNPEKRVKAGYKAFEKARLEQIRQENPSLRLNQVKQLLRKQWERSSQNPLNRMQ